MYLQCVLISRDKTPADEQMLLIMSENRSKSRIEAYHSKKYQSNIRSNPKYIDTQLTQQSIANNKKLKSAVEKYQVDFVLVSPLKADLQTCYDLFGESDNNTVAVQPLLLPRINSVTNIPEKNSELIQKFKVKPLNTKIEENQKWFSNYGSRENKEQGLKGVQEQELQEVQPVKECMQKLQNQEDYETHEHYIERLGTLKKELITYIGKTKTKLAIIAHPEVLEALTSTGHHQDFTFVNIVPFNYGQVKSEFIFIEGVEGERETETPFCS